MKLVLSTLASIAWQQRGLFLIDGKTRAWIGESEIWMGLLLMRGPRMR